MRKNIIIAVLAILCICSLAYSFHQNTRAEEAEAKVEELISQNEMAAKQAQDLLNMARAQAEHAKEEAIRAQLMVELQDQSKANE